MLTLQSHINNPISIREDSFFTCIIGEKPSLGARSPVLWNAVYDKLNIDDDPLNTGSVIPLYPLTQELQKAGIENRFFRKIIRRMLKEINNIPDFFPPKFLQKNKLLKIV